MSTIHNTYFVKSQQMNMNDDVYMHLRNRDVHNLHEQVNSTVKSHVYTRHRRSCKKVNFSNNDYYDEIYMHLRNRDIKTHCKSQKRCVQKIKIQEEDDENILYNDEIYMHLRNRDVMTHNNKISNNALENKYKSVIDYLYPSEKKIIARLPSLRKFIGYP